MRKFIKFIGPGMIAILLSGTALAHGGGAVNSYPLDGWSGSVAVWGNSAGYTGYSGNISYVSNYAYAPGYALVPGPGPGYGPCCMNGRGKAYAKGHRHGPKHGRKHARKHHGRHH